METVLADAPLSSLKIISVNGDRKVLPSHDPHTSNYLVNCDGIIFSDLSGAFMRRENYLHFSGNTLQ